MGDLGGGELEAINRKVRAVHPAEVATAAFFRTYEIRRMISFGIKSGGQTQHMRWTKLDADTAAFAPFHNY
jgi:hypothetical protein